MSIHVTVNGSPVNIRRGRMVLSDLDQIKKNERDRRRRLRLEQVRQQSREISNRLLERAKKIAREELNKLEKNGKSELKQMHDRKIMEIQQKYREDLEDIGQAHASAALQPDVDAIIEQEGKKDRTIALKRGKDAMQWMKEAKEKDNAEATHQERKIKEVENTEDAVITILPKQAVYEGNSEIKTYSSQEDTSEEIDHKKLNPKKKNKKISKKSSRRLRKSNIKEHQKTLTPKPGASGLQKSFILQLSKTSRKDTNKVKHIKHITDNINENSLPRKTIPVVSTTSTKADRLARYNPEDYTQDMSNTSSISSNSSSSVSDDSSYFSDSAEQNTCNKILTPALLTNSKVHLYDHSTRQKNVYDRPLGMVERIDTRSEPNAVEAAQAMKDTESIKTHIIKNRKLAAERRGEDAILREKVRRDYQELLENLDHLAQEERKLRASQVQCNVMEDVHMRLHQRNKCQEEHEKKLDRTAAEILNTDGAPSHLTERVITLPLQRNTYMHTDVPHSTWQTSHLIEEEGQVCHTHTEQDKEDELSREEQILDMLKKVERQKRLLLQEFGANLPDDIFNASIKPLFEARTPVKALQVRDISKSLSPDIKVINMSSCDKCVKRDRKTKKSDKSPMKKIEIAVQATLDKTVPAEDKSIQVQLSEENTDIPRSSSDTAIQRPHPIEPKITIITPETDDSSNDSASSEITGMVIEIDKKEVTVTPKKRKSILKISRQPLPRVYHKIRSTSAVSKATSPIKRFTRSQSSSRLSSTRGKLRCSDTTDTTSRKIDIHVSRSGVSDEIEPSQETRVSIDASTESSQTFSGLNDQGLNQCPSKPYRIRTQMKKWIRIKDTSDTSTSFASPPPVKPKSTMGALTNVTPILEILDSLGPEELKRQDISPVSTPETPSPRTMMMPSNIPHCTRISRMLKYNSIDSQTNDSIIFSSTQYDQSTMTDLSDIHQQEPVISESSSRQPSVSSKICTCKNPECKLLHTRLEDIHDYALKNCPEILQKYEDLQNLCTERIASLTDLIEKVRNEQKDMDFSLINPSDETSLMQISSSKPAHHDIQAVRKLVENIEAVHAQLAKTLLESQRIIGKDVIPEEISRDAEVQATTSTPRSKSVDTVLPIVPKTNVVKGKAKPMIINDENVNLQFNQLKIQQKPRLMLATKTFERNSWPPYTNFRHEEEVIEELLKQILEVRTKPVTLKRLKEEKDFVPILAGIPKISHAHGIPPINARAKPPVTLLNVPYRSELESSGHELSTIAEFDTPDTASRSVNSPIKSRNISINAMEHLQKKLLRKSMDTELFKSATTIKPSVHVAPLPVQQNQNFSKKLAGSTLDVECSIEKFAFTQGLQETTTICGSVGKFPYVTDSAAIVKNEVTQDWIDYGRERCDSELQCNTADEQPAVQTNDRLGSSINIDFNNSHKNSKNKSTSSTSLNSFSGLSGVSEITSSPSSDILKYASSPEEMETALKKLGLGWAVTTLKKTREACALSSSSNSDVTPINTARRMISPTKKHLDSNGLLDFSDVSSISIKEQASKSTEQVLSKGRTSTPKLQNINSNSGRSSTTNTSESFQEPSDSLTVPNISLTKIKSDNKKLQTL